MGIEFTAFAYKRVCGTIVDGYRDSKYTIENNISTVQLDEETEYGYSVDYDVRIDLTRALILLDVWERRLLNLLYAADKSLGEVGTMAGVSESRVCQLHTGVLNKLRKTMQVAT